MTAAPTTVPVKPTTSTATPALYQQALAQAKAALAAQQAPIRGEITANDATAVQRSTDAGNAASALSEILRGIGPRVQQDYGQAADRQGVLAKGFSDGMQAALQKSGASDNALLNQIGAPAGQQIDPAKATASADALYGVGGYIPASSFNREGAAFTAAADQLPGIALLKGQENQKSIASAAQAQDVSLQNKIAELAGNLPGDALKNYQSLQSLALSNAKFAEQLNNDKFNQAYKTASLNLNTQYKNAQLGLSEKRLNLDAQKFAQTTLNQNRNYQVSLANLGIRSAANQRAAIAAEFKYTHGGFDQKAVTKFDATLQGLANKIVVGTDKSGGTTFSIADARDKTGKTMMTISYRDYVSQAVARGVPPSLALDRANKIFPDGYRGSPDDLASVLGISKAAAAAGSGWTDKPGASDYNNMVGIPAIPKNLSPGTKQTVSKVLDLAYEFLGTPYAWGGESPGGFDCSGLAQYIYAQAGVQIPRVTYDQFRSGTPVSKGQLAAGDLVFFKGSDSRNGLPGHVGIYVGSGKFIEAPKTGSVVKVSSLVGRSDYMGGRRYSG